MYAKQEKCLKLKFGKVTARIRAFNWNRPGTVIYIFSTKGSPHGVAPGGGEILVISGFNSLNILLKPSFSPVEIGCKSVIT